MPLNNLTKRIAVAVIGIPIIVTIVYFGEWLLWGFVQIVAIGALWEYYAIVAKLPSSPNRVVGYLGSIVIQTAFFYADRIDGLANTPALFIGCALFLAFSLIVFAAELWREKPRPIINTAVTLAGILYVTLPLGCLLGLRHIFEASWIRLPQTFDGSVIMTDAWGAALVFSVFAGIWLSDSAAYFAGLAFGKRKLFPRVSPKKSWEGAIAGFIASTGGFAALTHYFVPVLPIGHALAIGICIGITAQLGDLAESLLKRDAGVKDSSNILPGHGGALDRFDSLLFVAPVVYIYVGILFYTGM